MKNCVCYSDQDVSLCGSNVLDLLFGRHVFAVRDVAITGKEQGSIFNDGGSIQSSEANVCKIDTLAVL